MAVKTKSRLTLEDFVLEMMHAPKNMQIEQLSQMFCNLCLCDELIEDNVHFHEDMYSRNLICRTPRFDMLVLCWLPGQASSVHDHCGSLNVTKVYRGALTSRIFSLVEGPAHGAARVELSEEEVVTAGKLATVDRGQIHQLANTSDEPLVTVHVYAHPLKTMNVYDREKNTRENVTLRYSLEDDFA